MILIYYKKSINEHKNILDELIKDNYNMQEASDLHLIVSERKNLEQKGKSKRKKKKLTCLLKKQE